jgi:hypothetical protein
MVYGITSFIMWGYISSVLLIYFTFRIWEKKILEWHDLVKISISTVVALHPFFFIVDVFFITIFLLYFIISNKKIYFTKIFSLGILVFLLNSFWIFPFVYSTLSVDNNLIHGKENNLNVFEAYTQVSTYVHIFSFITVFNNLGARLYFGLSQYFYYFSLLGFFLFSAFSLRNKKFIILLFLFFLILIDLSMGPRALLSGDLFVYLWGNFPFFSFFRSFKRFFIFVPVLYMFIFALYLCETRYKKILTSFLVIITVLVHYPLLTGNLSDVLPSFRIPDEYQVLNSVLKNDKEYSNVLVLPFNHYERYSWANNRNNIEPMNYYWLQSFLNKPPILNGDAVYLIQHSGILDDLNKKILLGSSTQEILSDLGVKYILVSKDAIDGHWNPVPYDVYKNYFNEKGYSLLEENSYFIVYQNNSFQKLLSLDDSFTIDYVYVSPTKINFEVNNIKGIVKFDFLQNYSKGWRLYLNQNNQFSHNIFDVNDISAIYATPFEEDSHSLNHGYANEWVFDVEKIKKNYPVNTYSTNPDGSINLRLSVLFINQSWFFLGTIFSLCGFLISCLILFLQCSIRFFNFNRG